MGCVLAHDVTEIIPGVRKGPAFRKGHVIQEEDIPRLLDIGKKNLYVIEGHETMVHEDEAASRLCRLCMGSGLEAGSPKEGKIELKATVDGLFMADRAALFRLNSVPEVAIASRSSGFTVKAGAKCAGLRVIPLMVEPRLLEGLEEGAGDPVFSVLPFRRLSYTVITTGSEVYSGRIKDAFTPVIEEKMAFFGCQMANHMTTDDDADMTASAIRKAHAEGSKLILCTGGMSVDPDDRTPSAIRAAGARVVSYGSPVLPGSMFLVAYFDDGTPVLGLPGCVMYSKRTIFDIVMPWIVCGVPITKEWIDSLGDGGLCLDCPTCIFPACGFGKGGH